MVRKSLYIDYIDDKETLSKYDTYQERYRNSIRESDRALIDIIDEVVQGVSGITILDIGCSTGNLLYHIKKKFPSSQLFGGDLAESSVAHCREDPGLSGIHFEIMDMLSIDKPEGFDIIVANAVAVYFDWGQYTAALESVASSLRSAGTFIAFEWLHPFCKQDIEIVETSEWHPDGLKFHFRPYAKVREAALKVGFTDVEFRPFTLPIDLPFPGHDSDVVTYTRKDEFGERMAFRGTLFQPWCHMIARKG